MSNSKVRGPTASWLLGLPDTNTSSPEEKAPLYPSGMIPLSVLFFKFFEILFFVTYTSQTETF